jgi:hypothetical protein
MEMQKGTRAGVILLAIGVTLLALSCGGKQSMASKSAAEYREAVAKGIPVGSGGHGGHTAEAGATASGGLPDMSSMNHGSMDSMPGMDHSKMQHGSSPSMANMPGMQNGSKSGINQSQVSHGSMAGMDHSQMQHGSTGTMANMPGMQHGSMPGMSNMPGVQHGATAVAPVLPAPTSSSGIAQLSPSATLRPDSFDQPAPVAVAEANKAGAEGGHTMQNTPAGNSQQKPSSPPPKPPDHSHHGANPNGDRKD